MRICRDIIETTLRAHRIDATRGEVDRAVLLATDSGEIAYVGAAQAIDLIEAAIHNSFEAFRRR